MRKTLGVLTVDVSQPERPDTVLDQTLPEVPAELILVAPLSELRYIAACFATPT